MRMAVSHTGSGATAWKALAPTDTLAQWEHVTWEWWVRSCPTSRDTLFRWSSLLSAERSHRLHFFFWQNQFWFFTNQVRHPNGLSVLR